MTSEVEEDYMYCGDGKTRHALPYELFDETDSGYVFRIVDDPSDYCDSREQRFIEVDAAWENSDNEYAWELVSYHTF